MTTHTLLALVLALAAFPVQEPESPADDPLAELQRIASEVSKEIEVLRNARFERTVAVEVTDKDGFKAYVERRLEATTSADEIALEEGVAKLLGIIPAEMDYLAAMVGLVEDQVGGFYDPAADRFYLMDSFGGDLARIIVAHELTHALDDQLYDLDASILARSGNSDALFAYQAVVEGSGTAVMNRWTIEHMAELDKDALNDAGNMGMDAMAEAPPYLWRPLLGAYLKGAAFLNRTSSVMKGQMGFPELPDFDAAFTAPPRSSEQILHPEKYWNADERDDPVAVSIDVGELPEGWRALGTNTLGEVGLHCASEPLKKRKGLSSNPFALMGVKYTDDPAEGWGGDRFVILRNGGEHLLRMETIWDTAGDALEFAEAMRELSEHVAESVGTLAIRLGSDDSGFLVEHEPDTLRVRLTSWVGVAQVTREALLAALSVTIG